MKKQLFIGCLGLIILAGCGMRMHQTQLVDEWGNTYEQSAARQFTDREVYYDQTVDVWGMEKTNCKNFSRVDSISYSGKSSLGLVWNKEGNCAWIGFGIGWNGYAAKDLSEVMQTGSIDFYVRSIKGNQFIPTFILLLEDYAGTQSAMLLKAKHLERYPITEAWQKVSVPLSGFLQSAAPLCDFSNIKSLNIECQGAGALYIDEISIGGALVQAGATKKYGQTITQNFPVTLFKEELQNAWGLGNFPGRNVQVIEEGNGNKTLFLSWNDEFSKKGNKQVGINWEGWQAISFPDTLGAYELKFKVLSTDQASISNLLIGFEDYDGKSVFVPIQLSYISEIGLNQKWQQVVIPFAEFNFEKSGFNANRFKQFLIQFKGKGELHFDDIIIDKRK
jgi:hypothetical protein